MYHGAGVGTYFTYNGGTSFPSGPTYPTDFGFTSEYQFDSQLSWADIGWEWPDTLDEWAELAGRLVDVWRDLTGDGSAGSLPADRAPQIPSSLADRAMRALPECERRIRAYVVDNFIPAPDVFPVTRTQLEHRQTLAEYATWVAGGAPGWGDVWSPEAQELSRLLMECIDQYERQGPVERARDIAAGPVGTVALLGLGWVVLRGIM